MIARNFQKENPKARFTINAGDINQSSLQIAKAGLYTSNSLRGKIEYFEEKCGNKNCPLRRYLTLLDERMIKRSTLETDEEAEDKEIEENKEKLEKFMNDLMNLSFVSKVEREIN